LGGRGGRVLHTLRLGHHDGGAPVEGATRSATEALSENHPEGVDGMLSLKFYVALFLFIATFIWLPPALHAGVTAAIVLFVLIIPIAYRWFTHRVR
jgi:hypothetical protein